MNKVTVKLLRESLSVFPDDMRVFVVDCGPDGGDGVEEPAIHQIHIESVDCGPYFGVQDQHVPRETKKSKLALLLC